MSQHPPRQPAMVNRWLELVRWAPTTTAGATTCTNDMNEPINGGIGLFGETPTTYVGGNVT